MAWRTPGIIEGDHQFHAAGVDSAELLGRPHAIAVRVPTVIQPGLIVETRRLDDERVARPTAYRGAEP